MTRIVVIGIGSLIMKDDAIGVRVVEAIQSALNKQGIVIVAGETDFQYCFDAIKKDDFLIIVDAMIQEKEPGMVEMIPLCDAIKNRRKLRTQHEFSLFDSVAVHYPNIKGYLIGIEPFEVDFGFDLSEVISNKFDEICDDVLNAILEIKEEKEYA